MQIFRVQFKRRRHLQLHDLPRVLLVVKTVAKDVSKASQSSLQRVRHRFLLTLRGNECESVTNMMAEDTHLIERHPLALAILHQSIAHIFMRDTVPKNNAGGSGNSNVVPLCLLVVIDLRVAIQCYIYITFNHV